VTEKPIKPRSAISGRTPEKGSSLTPGHDPLSERLNFAGTRRDFLKSLLKLAPVVGLSALGVGLGQIVAANQEKQYDPTKHWYGMGIDVHRCIGCGRCVEACKEENNVPRYPYFFRTWVERYVETKDGEVRVDSPNGSINAFPPSGVPEQRILKTFYVPKICNHCAEPPCVQVCPVGATFLSRDGVVLVDESYCIGCRYCIQACPYGARYLHPKKRVADKCTFCYHRITKGLRPACVEVCPTSARIFGEARRANTPLWEFVRTHDIQVLKPHLRTSPKVYYCDLDSEVR